MDGDWHHSKNVDHSFVRQHVKISLKLPARGYSTAMNKDRLLKYLSIGHHLHEDIAERKEEVLLHMGIKEEDTWGKGLLIFCLRKRGEYKVGLHTRFLPTLIKGQSFKEKSFTTSGYARMTRDFINTNMQDKIKAWIEYSYKRANMYDVMVVQFLMALKGMFMKQKELVQAIINEFLHRNTGYEAGEDENDLKREVTFCVHKAIKCGFINVSKKGGARLFTRDNKTFQF